MKCSTKNPGSKLRCRILGARLSSVQQAAAPPRMEFQHSVQIEPCLVAIEQALADTDHRAGDYDLITEFRLLPSAWSSLMHDLLTQEFEERHDGLYCFARRLPP